MSFMNSNFWPAQVNLQIHTSHWITIIFYRSSQHSNIRNTFIVATLTSELARELGIESSTTANWY